MDHSKFECEADDITAADTLYEKAGKRMDKSKKGKKSIPANVITWSPDWTKQNFIEKTL